MKLGNRLQTLRGAVSQSAFGKRLGVSQASIGTYEKGDRLPDSAFIERVCNEFDVSADWLLFGNEPHVPDDPHVPEVPCQRCAELEKLVHALERENALLRENAALQARNQELTRRLSLSAGALDQSPHASTA